jgi:hypothetical protein
MSRSLLPAVTRNMPGGEQTTAPDADEPDPTLALLAWRYGAHM